MIYERWFTVKDTNDLDYLYYSEIRKKPFGNAERHQNKTFHGLLEKRMRKLLKREVGVELNYQNLIAGLPVSFTIYYRNIPIVEYGGNYLDLNSLRNEIYLIDQFDIRRVLTRIDESGAAVKLVHVKNDEYCIPAQRSVESAKSSGRRNYLPLSDDLIKSIYILPSLQNGKGTNRKEIQSLR